MATRGNNIAIGDHGNQLLVFPTISTNDGKQPIIGHILKVGNHF